MKVDLQRKGHHVRGHFPKHELLQLASENKIELTIQRFGELEGWIGKPKGLLYVGVMGTWICKQRRV